MVWPTSWEGEAIGGNVRSNAHEGQLQHTTGKELLQLRVLRSETGMRDLTAEERKELDDALRVLSS